MRKQNKINIPVCVFCLLIILSAILFFKRANVQDSPSPQTGMPVIYTEELNLGDMRIDQILHDSSLYILDGDHGYIRVFDLSGIYQYTIALYDYMNGYYSMALSDGVLYVRDPHFNMYLFEENSFILFIPKDEVGQLGKMLDFSLSSDQYVLQFGSVWQIKGNDKVCVIQRSGHAIGHMIGICLMGVVMLLGISKHPFKRQRLL